MWQAQVFTLYPDFFPGPLNKGLYGKALTNKIWDLKVVNIREAAEDKHKTVDDTPFGGGSGMLLKADILAKSLDENKKEGERIFYLSPKGKKLDQKLALELSKEKSISLICGHFEGVDERLLSTRNIEELSIGDFILSGGETASFVVLDSILRLLPGVLGNEKSKDIIAWTVRHNESNKENTMFGLYPSILRDLFKQRAEMKKELAIYKDKKEHIEKYETNYENTKEYKECIFKLNYSDTKQKALKDSNFIRENFTWQNAAKIAIDHLSNKNIIKLQKKIKIINESGSLGDAIAWTPIVNKYAEENKITPKKCS